MIKPWKDKEDMMRAGETMFSMTVTTVDVSWCAQFRHAAMCAIDSSFVAAPTVDPGLKDNELSGCSHKRAVLFDQLKIVTRQAEELASLQIVHEALVRLFTLLAG
jgi:hypothetical protein